MNDPGTAIIRNQHLLEACLKDAGAAVPPAEFCAIVSSYFHAVEARYYDSFHGEIFASATEARWHEALDAAGRYLGSGLRVLDIGCGTGFEAGVVIDHLGPGRIEAIVCADPSRDMLAACERKLAAFGVEKAFLCADVSGVPRGGGGFNLIVTNSVVHHVFELPEFFARIDELAAPGALYVTGHEPAAAYYTNDAMLWWNRLFNRSRRVRLNLSGRRLARRLAAAAAGLRPRQPGITEIVNEQLLRHRHASKPLPANAIRKLVDIHVPLSSGDYPWGEPGFSPESVVRDHLPGWTAAFSRTYHHIKAPSTSLSALWRAIGRRLERRYPACGSDIIMAFVKTR